MKVEAHAKINLALDITGKRPDGYHLVRMVMQSLALHDTIEIEKAANDGRQIVLHSDSELITDDENNLAWKAAKLLIDEFAITDTIVIRIKKCIPIAAGLAGGSSDAAAVLKGVNKLFSLGLSEKELMERGVRLGADVPYCICGGTMLSEGIGEILTRTEGKMPSCGVLLVKPKEGVSTKKVYQLFDSLENEIHADVDGVLEGLRKEDLAYISDRMSNVLEKVTIPMLPVIDAIKKDMIKAGAIGSLMSGSGPTVFGFFKEKDSLEKTYSLMKENYADAEVIVSCIE
ncbi:MAG: 4-(cytidine 5'-diphospho)-2-C-methyl-D-erythritol kinase [Lachnospiraceae bacterium]|nr:4-(cytidine 5'-diphospho)-2-C-methyl-D-erythritol kinase [Lachnospiraceae bacterium]MDN4741956.1 4-(cytidine 5'-diphospho)-2-C-methyl-D-erythritol kinase [Lachnospiraceae bacterium C1.1]